MIESETAIHREDELEGIQSSNSLVLYGSGNRHASEQALSLEPWKEEPNFVVTYWRLIRRRRGLVLLVGFLGLLITGVATLLMQPVYQAHLSLEIQGLNDNFMNMKSVDPTNPLPDYSAEAYIQTEMKILQSDLLLQRTVEKLKTSYRQLPPPGAATSSGWQRLWHRNPDPKSTWDVLLASAARGVQVRVAGTTHIVEIFCDSADPTLAADFANVLVKEFIDHNRESRWKTTQDTGEWLGTQLQDVRAKLEKSGVELQEYARQTGIQITSEKISVAEEKLRQVQEELTKAQADRVLKQSVYDLSVKQPNHMPEILETSDLNEYRSKLLELRRKRAELRASMTPENPKVGEVDGQITEIQSALDKERQKLVQRARDGYEAAQGREDLLTEIYKAQAALVTDQSAKAIKYDVLKREVDTNRQMYEAMLQRVREAGISAAMQSSNFSVVDEAKPPSSPYKPSLPKNASLGFLAGLLVGIVIVAFEEHADRSIQSPGDSQICLNLPELGVVPSAKPVYVPRISLSRNGHSRQPSNVPGIGEASNRVELVMYDEQPSAMKESFRAILASLLFASRGSKESKLYVLTSPSVAEGKTTVASNLCIALTETRRRVLLVDADMRRPRLHDVYGVANEQGLSTLLESQLPLNMSDVDALIRPAGVQGLAILPSGPAKGNIGNLLYSARLPELTRLLRQSFDIVIFDTPPVMQMPDARILGGSSDAVILVVRSRKTQRDTALVVKELFRKDGTPVIGVILNDWDPSRNAVGAYGLYYRDYEKYVSSVS
jgi:capsular exopolysaccharide synthesis family protein